MSIWVDHAPPQNGYSRVDLLEPVLSRPTSLMAFFSGDPVERYFNCSWEGLSSVNGKYEPGEPRALMKSETWMVSAAFGNKSLESLFFLGPEEPGKSDPISGCQKIRNKNGGKIDSWFKKHMRWITSLNLVAPLEVSNVPCHVTFWNLNQMEPFWRKVRRHELEGKPFSVTVDLKPDWS